MQQNSSININSKYIIDRLENDLIQLTRVLAIEQQQSIETSKIAARHIIQTRLNQLLTQEEKEGINRLSKQIKEDIKQFNGTAGRISNPKDIYELLKTFDLL